MLVPQAARSLCLLFLIPLAIQASAQQPECDLPEFVARADIPGLGLAEVEGRRIEVSSYGFAEAPVRCVTDDTVFEAASLTKPVVAFIVMRLVDRQRLSLDDALLDHLPSLPLPKDDPRSRRVTIRTALAHTTGLQGPDVGGMEFVREPGAAFEYYPAGYRLVQRVLEHIEGDSLEQIAKREVFGPLGMTSSSLVFREDLLDRIAVRHRMLGETIQRERDPAWPPNAAASLVTTPGDYGRFLRAMLSGPELSGSSRLEMLTPQVLIPETEDRVAWGIGWGLEPGRGTFFHWGDDGAAKSFTIGSVDEDRAAVYFANSFYGMAIATDVSRRLIPGDSPAVQWLGYASWDSPRRLVRRDSLRAFVEGDAALGMETFERFDREYPELEIDNDARFLTWVLDVRGKHAGRAKMLEWQIRRQPSDPSLHIERARSLREIGDDAGAMDALSTAAELTQGAPSELLSNRVQWIQDEIDAADPSRPASPADMNRLAGEFGERVVTFEAGGLWYQRVGRDRYRLRWMTGTTYALEGVDSFRLRFDLVEGKAERVVGLYDDGRSDESPRTDDR